MKQLSLYIQHQANTMRKHFLDNLQVNLVCQAINYALHISNILLGNLLINTKTSVSMKRKRNNIKLKNLNKQVKYHSCLTKRAYNLKQINETVHYRSTQH